MRRDDGRDAARVEQLRARLLEAAFLFDEPATYEAGVEDTFAALLPLFEGAGSPQVAEGAR